MEATGLKDYLATRLGILKEWALRASTVDHPPIYISRLHSEAIYYHYFGQYRPRRSCFQPITRAYSCKHSMGPLFM